MLTGANQSQPGSLADHLVESLFEHQQRSGETDDEERLTGQQGEDNPQRCRGNDELGYAHQAFGFLPWNENQSREASAAARSAIWLLRQRGLPSRPPNVMVGDSAAK